MKNIFFTAIIFLFFIAAQAQIKEISYTLDDRDRLIRVEEQIKALQNEMNVRFEAIDDKINKLYTLMYFVLGGVFGLIGFVIYDRRTALTPVTRDNKKLKEILYEFAKTSPELKEILNKAAL
ncbi:MAG: hypothetical protein FVQ77_03720 [Cytophagales bacterium]|nr:hypothetical protein [Cytophagales bacterium]